MPLHEREPAPVPEREIAHALEAVVVAVGEGP